MRIALLDPPSYSLAYDHHLATALASRGHDVDLVTSPFALGEPPSPDGYRRSEVFLPLSGRLLRRSPRSAIRVPLKAVEYGPSVVRLLVHVLRARPDMVHVQWLPLRRRDLVWARRLPRPRLLTAHNVIPHVGDTDEAERRAIYAAFDAVVVHTRAGVEHLRRFGVPDERIARIPHGTFGAPPASAISPPTGRNLLFFGLIRRYKGLDTLVRALAEVPDATLVVAGDPLDDSIDAVRALAVALGVDDRIDWRLGYLPPEDVEALMRRATITVFPYRGGESASGALATALGHGRPAVVTEPLGEAVRDYEAGKVVPPEDPHALADAIRALLDPVELARAYEGAARAREGLSWDAIAEAHERLYADLLARVSAG